MMKILAGDWRAGAIATFRVSTFRKRPKWLIMPGKFPYERINFDEIAAVEPVTEQNQTSVLGKAAWGAAGAVLLGPVGLLAGVLGGGRRQRRIVSLTFTDGRKALLDCSVKDFTNLLSISYGTRS